MAWRHQNTALILGGMIAFAILYSAGFQFYEKKEEQIRRKYWSGKCNFAQTLRLKVTGVEPLDYAVISDLGEAKAQITHIVENVSEWGCLPFGHWYRIGYDPSYPGVVLKDSVKEKYTIPKLETIWVYLEHEFKGVNLLGDSIVAIVYFDGVPSLILIPIDAITYFDDPSRNYVLWPYGEPEEDAKLPD